MPIYLFVQGKGMDIQKCLVKVLALPQCTYTFAQTSIYEWTRPREAGGEATLMSHYG